MVKAAHFQQINEIIVKIHKLSSIVPQGNTFERRDKEKQSSNVIIYRVICTAATINSHKIEQICFSANGQ